MRRAILVLAINVLLNGSGFSQCGTTEEILCEDWVIAEIENLGWTCGPDGNGFDCIYGMQIGELGNTDVVQLYTSCSDGFVSSYGFWNTYTCQGDLLQECESTQLAFWCTPDDLEVENVVQLWSCGDEYPECGSNTCKGWIEDKIVFEVDSFCCASTCFEFPADYYYKVFETADQYIFEKFKCTEGIIEFYAKNGILQDTCHLTIDDSGNINPDCFLNDYPFDLNNTLVFECNENCSYTIPNIGDVHQDYYPLMALYNSTNGNQWANTQDNVSPWGQSCDPCDGNWYGIECENDRVTCIDLSGFPNCSGSSSQGNLLNGKIPKEIGDLSELKVLNLAVNNISGSIPLTFYKLSKLEILNLDNNQLSGIIHENLGNLIALKLLNLTDNGLSGPIPQNIGSLSNVENIFLSRNNFNGSIPPSLGNLENLVYFQANSCGLEGLFPQDLIQLSNLRELEVTRNNIEGKIPSDLGSLINIERINLGWNNLDDCFDQNLLNLCSKVVYFGNNPLLPWQGDFDQFCMSDGSQDSQVGAPCEINGEEGTIDDNCECVKNCTVGDTCNDSNNCTTNDYYDESCYCIASMVIDSLDYVFTTWDGVGISIEENSENCIASVLIFYGYNCPPCQELYSSHDYMDYESISNVGIVPIMLEAWNTTFEEVSNHSFDFINNNSFPNVIEGGEQELINDNCFEAVPQIWVICPNKDTVGVIKSYGEDTPDVVKNYVEDNCDCRTNKVNLSYNDASGSQGDTLDFYLTVEGFTEIAAFEFGTYWDTTQLEFLEIDMLNSNVTGFTNFSYVVFDDLITFTWNHPDVESITLQGSSLLFRLRLKVISDKCDNSMVDLGPSVAGNIIFADASLNIKTHSFDDGIATLYGYASLSMDHENGETIEVCMAEPFTFNTSTISDARVHMECDFCSPNVDLTDLGGGDIHIEANMPGTFPITFYAHSESCGRGDSIILDLTVHDPGFEIDVLSDEYCAGDEVQFSLAPFNIISYDEIIIRDDLGTIIYSGTDMNASFVPTGSGFYYVTAIDQVGCLYEEAIELIEYPAIETPTIQCTQELGSITFSWNDVGAVHSVNVISGQSGILNGNNFMLENIMEGELVNIELVVSDPNGVCEDIIVPHSCTYQSGCLENSFAYLDCSFAIDNPICDFSLLQGNCYTMPEFNNNGPSPFCSGFGVTDNISWMGYIAGGGNYNILINASNCMSPAGDMEGIQVAVYEIQNNCMALDMEVFCSGPDPLDNVVIPGDVMIPGLYYVILLDGFVGTVCDYDVGIDGNFVPYEYQIDELCVVDPVMDCEMPQITMGTEVSIEPFHSSFPLSEQDMINWKYTDPSGSDFDIESGNRFTILPSQMGVYTVCIQDGVLDCVQSSWGECMQFEVIDEDCNHPDLPALISLYNSTNGDDWFNNDGWKDGVNGTNCDPCDGTWYGIQCENDRVVCLDLDGENNCEINYLLDGNNLVGLIPTEIGQLEKLEFLYLRRNKLSGSIPTSIGNLKMLKILHLDQCLLENDLPSEIGQLVNLEEMYIGQNKSLSGEILSEISKLKELRVFSAYNNSISGNIPVELVELTELERFDLYNNDLNGTIPEQIGDLKRLVELDFSNNNITGTIPPSIGEMNVLRRLWLNNNALTGVIPNTLGQIENLELLFLRNNLLEGPIPEELGDLKILQIINLDNNNLSGCFPEELCFIVTDTLYDCSWNSNVLQGCQYDFRNNPLLPWQGNIEPFCNGEPQIGAPCLLDGQEGIIDENCNCALKEECEYLLEKDEITIEVSQNYTIDLLANDELPTAYSTSITSISHTDILKEYSYNDGVFEFVINESFSDSIFVDYEVCDPDCVDCIISQLFITNEAIQHITQTNVISPDGDGSNDGLRFTTEDIVENSELWIYNRWGDRIFYMENYDNNWTAEGYPGGIYFYVLKVNGVIIKKTLTVIK